MHLLKCKCGAVKGEISAGGPNNRVRCYCTDCRAFANFLGMEADVLDAQGGTEVIQVSQARVRITQGLDQLAAIRLSDKGMLRWYASCCKMPIGNSMADPRWFSIDLVHSCLEHSKLDQDFGSSTALISTGTALGDPKPKQQGLLGAIIKFAWIVIPARLLGRYKHAQLFTSARTPIVTPTVLSPSEVQQLKHAS